MEASVDYIFERVYLTKTWMKTHTPRDTNTSPMSKLYALSLSITVVGLTMQLLRNWDAVIQPSNVFLRHTTMKPSRNAGNTLDGLGKPQKIMTDILPSWQNATTSGPYKIS